MMADGQSRWLRRPASAKLTKHGIAFDRLRVIYCNLKTLQARSYTRTKTLRSVVGQSVSYVKNALRILVSSLYCLMGCTLSSGTKVRDTLYGPDPSGVTQATREAIRKFLGFGRQADAKDVIYMMFIVSIIYFRRAMWLTISPSGIMLAATGPFWIGITPPRVSAWPSTTMRGVRNASAAAVILPRGPIFGLCFPNSWFPKVKSGGVRLRAALGGEGALQAFLMNFFL